MADLGRLLIADDDETFLHSTADLLRRENYYCDCALDGNTATHLLQKNAYDLLIADIKMPGNPQLELIKNIPNIAEGIPVILVTGYPSLDSAITSIKLPVVAYLVKPIDFDQLLAHVRTAIEHSRTYDAIRNTREHLENWLKELAGAEKLMKEEKKRFSAIGVDNFIEFSFHNIVGALSDLKNLANTNIKSDEEIDACHLLNCQDCKSSLRP